MIISQTRQQKKSLVACAVIFLVLGASITIAGFVFEYHDVYDEISDAKIANVQRVMFPRTQYWLGLPLFLLAFYVSITRFYSWFILHLFGLVLCSFAMVASLCASGLQSVMWYISLDLANIVYTAQCTDVYADVNNDYSSNPRCNCKRELHYSNANDMQEDDSLLSHMTCSDVKRFPSIVGVLVILSILTFLVCQATCFVYVKILRLLEPVHSDGFNGTSQHVLLNEQQL